MYYSRVVLIVHIVTNSVVGFLSPSYFCRKYKLLSRSLNHSPLASLVDISVLWPSQHVQSNIAAIFLQVPTAIDSQTTIDCVSISIYLVAMRTEQNVK